MLIQAKTFNSHTIWDTDYLATVLNPSAMPDAKPVFIEESLGDSDYSGMFTRDVRNVALQVRILDYANREDLLAQLKDWFKTGTRGDLVATFAVDGEDYLLPCVVQAAPVGNGDQSYTIILQSEATAWRAVTADTDTWNMSGAGGTHAITVEGDTETKLSVTLIPTVQRPAGYLHQNMYQLVPVNGLQVGLRPWCISLDTAALVSAGKMQADCDDLRIWLDEAETRRWIESPNTNHTKVWFNINLRRGETLKLKTAVASSGDIPYLYFKKDATHRTKISAMPSHGIVHHGAEWFYYSAKNVKQCRLTVETRGLYDTTLAAHSAGDTFDFIPAAVRVVYKNSAATDPSLDDENYDDTKPLFNLGSSDNTKWVWTANDLFYDPDHPQRPGGWIQALTRLGPVSKLYWIKQDAETGDAAMGMTIGAWLKGSTWKAEQAVAAWKFHDPLGMQKVTVTGRKYRNTAKWPDTYADISRSPNGTTWYSVFHEATPASASSWTALTNDSAANTIASTTKYVRVIFSRVLGALANALARLEILTATLEFTTANIPTGSLLGEQANYHLEVTLTNNTNGDSLDLLYPMRMNRGFALNGEANTVKYHGGNAHQALDLDDDGRSVWIRLAKGSNTLAITAEDAGTLQLVLSWYRRRL